MGKAFADRWGVPVRAGSADAVALLDEAIEDLAALAGDPVAGAEAAVAADDSLVLGHIYRTYLQLYGTTPEGVAAAGEILKRLDETVMGERELHTCAPPGTGSRATGKLRPARWSVRCCATRATCSRSRSPRTSTSSSATGSSSATPPPGCCPPGRATCRAGGTCRASTRSVLRRTRTTGRPKPAPGPRLSTIRRTSGRCTRWRTSSRWKAASGTASTS